MTHEEELKMLTQQDRQLLKLAVTIKPFKGHYYLDIQEIATIKFDFSRKLKTKVPTLKKLGIYEVKVPFKNNCMFSPTVKDFLLQMPEEYIKAGAVAFEIQTKEEDLEKYHYDDYIPVKTVAYALKDNAKVPDAIKSQSISLYGENYTVDEINEM